ncbi:hypothetical protein PR048_005009 [Dryococelus australis]|uniref:Uncharacterized protein n=1 Tax=Dryococelus australis TaxID=614101 RepID=A0ABQ9I702_9NEOP|nr:hypothetical protein PR048_005009 [Dryococelus australis]
MRVKRGESGEAPEYKEQGKWEIPKKTHRQAALPITIPTCANPGTTLKGNEPSSPWGESKKRNMCIYPPYGQILKAKGKCYPKELCLTDTKGEVQLQNVLDRTAERLLTVHKTVLQTNFPNEAQVCYICEATPQQMNNLQNVVKRKVQKTTFNFGIYTTRPALSCGYDIDTEGFRKYAFETAQIYVKRFIWFYMPTSVHKNLIHGSDVMDDMILPIGQLSEDVQEARHKE